MRRGELVVIPGAGNKVMGAVLRALPAAAARRLGGAILRRSLASE
jgi:hypothetical protein